MFLCGLMLVADTERHHLQNFICVHYFILLEIYKSTKISTRENEERLSSIEEQIDWLEEIGFVDSDCYWKWLQFALLIGFKPNKQK